jgi:hypothetical protein
MLMFMSCSSNIGSEAAEISSPMASPASQTVIQPAVASFSPALSPQTAAATPPPSREVFMPDANIPDVVLDPQANMANANNTIYEDGNNIYFLNGYNGTGENKIYRINKGDQSVDIIINICDNYTLYEDNIFYISHKTKDGCRYDYCIKKYHIKTEKTTELVKLRGRGLYIACYNHKIYYTMQAKKEPNDEGFYTFVYICNLDGTKVKKLFDGPLSFCMYKNKMYYVKPSGGEGGNSGDIVVYDMNSKKAKYTGIGSLAGFAIGYDILIPAADNNAYNINAWKSENFLPAAHDMLKFCGQYAFNYTASRDSMRIYAYDLFKDKNYSLIEIAEKT